MCLAGVFLGVCEVIFISVISTCNGVAPTNRANCVSVLILLGMRLRRPMRKGRISCLTAASSVITMTPSCSRVERAGRSLGILIGIGNPSGFGTIDYAAQNSHEISLAGKLRYRFHGD